MIFTHIGRIVAILALVFGVLKIAIGLTIATEILLPYEAALSRYAPGASSSGEVINKGMCASSRQKSRASIRPSPMRRALCCARFEASS
jgi:hypothetical protein